MDEVKANTATLGTLVGGLPTRDYAKGSIPRFLFFIANEIDPILSYEFSEDLTPNPWPGSPLRPAQFSKVIKEDQAHAQAFLRSYDYFECIQGIDNAAYLERLESLDAQQGSLMEMESVLEEAHARFEKLNSECMTSANSRNLAQLKSTYSNFDAFVDFIGRDSHSPSR